MDSFDSPRSTVPARMAPQRPMVPAMARNAGGLAEAPPPSPISVRVAVRGVRRYWWLVLILWVIGSAGAGVAINWKVKPSYRAASTLRVQTAVTDLYGSSGKEQAETFLNTQVQLIKSPNVLSAAANYPRAAALERIQKAGDVVTELKKAITVTIIPGTSLIEVSMTSTESPSEASILVNAVVDSFLQTNKEWAEATTKGQIKLLEAYESDLKSQAEQVATEWRRLVNNGNVDSQIDLARPRPTEAAPTAEGTPSPTKKSMITLAMIKEVNQKLFNTTLELNEAEATLAAMKGTFQAARAMPRSGVDQAQIEEKIQARFLQDPAVIALAEQLMEAKEKRDKLGKMSRLTGDPAERNAHEQLKKLQAKYDRLWEVKERRLREELMAASLPGGSSDAERGLREMVAKVELLKIRQATLQDQYNKLETTTKSQSRDEVSIALVLDKRESLKGMTQAVERRLEQLRFESRGEDRITQINPAMPSQRPISDNRIKYMAMTPVGVLGVVLGLVVLMEIRSARVADPDVLSSRIRQEVFAIAPLPEIRGGEEGNDEKSDQRLARFVQSLDHLRVALCEGGGSGEGRCVMITSATGGEGKTTLAAHLAARCANAHTSTLLIDADLRRASLGRLLDVTGGPGLGDVLAGEVSFEAARTEIAAGGFHFLSAGTPGWDPSQVLKSGRLSELLGRLRQTYDLVIIDTPPILPVADALIVGRWADGAVMAARFDASRLPLVERANRQLATSGIPVLGVVVNGVKGQHAAYGNYAYSYNYTGPADRRSSAVPDHSDEVASSEV